MSANDHGGKEYYPTNASSIDRPWQDEQVLRDLYIKERLTQQEVAERLGCSQSTIKKWIHRRDIPITDPRGRNVRNRPGFGFPANFGHTYSGSGNVMYEIWTDDGNHVRVHRLLAVAEYGFDAVDRDTVVHHKNGIGWDNRPENIEPMDHCDHSEMHGAEVAENGNGWFA